MDRPTNLVTRAGVILFALAGAACARPLETLRIDGSPGVAPLVRALVTSYREREPAARVELATGLGSSARLRAVQEGRIHIAMASHGVDDADLARRGLASRPIARTAVVFGVNAGVAVGSLTARQVCDIVAGRVTSWRDLGGPDLAIRAAIRPRGEVDADVAYEGVPCLRELRPAPGVMVVERPDEMARLIASTAGAIGLTSAPMVEQSGGRIRAVVLDGAAPTVENVATGGYPLTRRAILVYKLATRGAVERFLAFVGSPEGARVIRANGAVP